MLRIKEPQNGSGKCLKRRARLLLLTLACMICEAAAAQEEFSPCGPLRSSGQYGPYDFRKEFHKLPIVISNHFTPEVESLIRGRTSASPGSDIDYTLRAIPNNPRALVAMMRLGEKEKTPKPNGATYSVECYFERAIRFQNDDLVAHMLYANFLIKNQRGHEAIAQLELVERQAGDNPFTHYNLGSLYFDLKEYGRALAQAHIAYSLGIQQKTLKEKLVAAGRWVEAPSESASNAASPDLPSSAASAATVP